MYLTFIFCLDIVKGLLGNGSSGYVYSAVNKMTKEKVAIKVKQTGSCHSHNF